MRHEPTLARNPRMVMQVKNLQRLGAADRHAIREQAGRVVLQMCGG